MKRVLVAGATGYLGKFAVKEFKKAGFYVKVLARKKSQLDDLKEYIDDSHIGNVTEPDSIKDICKDIDIVFSSIGITRQKDGLTYHDVDYMANLNLLKDAMNHNIKKFIYVSVLNGEKLRHVQICKAKEQFVDELKKSGVTYSVIRPNGFFSDMKDFLSMAKKGKVYLFGDGELRMNPIHGEDLATACVEAVEKDNTELNIGGPDVLTHNDITELALEAMNKKVKISHLPDWIRKLTIGAMKTFTSVKTYGPAEFFLSAMAIDMTAPTYGNHHLKDFFIESADSI